jgi:metal-responsive CopG/Arc/MetJ family transcriptional regulator
MICMAKEREPAEESTDQINVRVSNRLLNRLDVIADHTGLKRSHHVQQAILEYVQRYEQQHQPQKQQPRH